jgi:hypothetical protein
MGGQWGGGKGREDGSGHVLVSRTVARTVYPRARSNLTIQDAMYPDAPVTHTIFPAPIIAASTAAELMSVATLEVAFESMNRHITKLLAGIRNKKSTWSGGLPMPTATTKLQKRGR